MAAPKRKSTRPTKRGAPARTVEARETELIGMAVDLAAEQLSAGTASSQVITHFLKLGTMRAKLEMEKLAQENELLKAKTEALASGKRIEALYEEALTAMRSYQGQEVDSGDIDD
jgi:hypothetical protein